MAQTSSILPVEAEQRPRPSVEGQQDVAGEDVRPAGRLIAWADIAGEEGERGPAVRRASKLPSACGNRGGAALQLENDRLPVGDVRDLVRGVGP